jgi:hypothetical protein
MKLKITLILIALLPVLSPVHATGCAQRKSELIKYACPAYAKNKNVSAVEAQNGWMPEDYKLGSKNNLQGVTISWGNDLAPSKEGSLRGSSGTTKLNQGYFVYYPYEEAGKWINGHSYYLQCYYKKTDVVLYKKIDKEARACDIHAKKTKSLPSKVIPTGVAICSTAENYIDKNIEPSDCLIGQSVNK